LRQTSLTCVHGLTRSILSQRWIVLTSTALFFSKEQDAITALDAVPLHEIEGIAIIDDSGPGASEILRAGSKHRRDLQSGTNTFLVRTQEDGYNSGRVYQLRAASSAEGKIWVTSLEKAVEEAKEAYIRAQQPGFIGACRRKVRFVVSTNGWQFGVSAIIVLSFIVTIVEIDFAKDCDESGDGAEDIEACDTKMFPFEVLDYAFTVLFVIDLLTTLFVDWFWAWAREGWNLFDFVVVTCSAISDLLPRSQTPSLDVLRLFRVFRVVRVFKRFKGLRAIINSLTSSIIPVTQSLSVLGVVSSIYSVLGVKLFKATDPKHFGTFGLSILSVMSISTGEVCLLPNVNFLA